MSFVAFILTVVLVSVPWLYYFPPVSHSTPSLVNVFLLLHTLFSLYYLIVSPPQNLFSHLNVPLSTPTEVLRGFLNKNASRYAALDQLITRMGSFDIRTFYVRLGIILSAFPAQAFVDLDTLSLQLASIAIRLVTLLYMPLQTFCLPTSNKRLSSVCASRVFPFLLAFDQTFRLRPLEEPERNDIERWGLRY
jgi:hypothetical protein